MAELASSAWNQIIAKARADARFKQRLLANPSAVLKENGIAIPVGTTVKIVEDTAEVIHLTLPASSAGELADEALAQVAGGILPYIEQDNRRPR